MTAAKQFANENGTRSISLARNVMKFALLLMAAFLVSVPARASMTSVYVGQSAAGAGDGSSCSNQKPVSFFNSSGNWGTASSQIGQDTTVHLCGTITTALTVQGSGGVGHPITIQWESGASVAVCVSYLTGGSIRISGKSYVIFDLGGNSAAITCPNNGTSKATQVEGVGISDFSGGINNVEVKNGTVGPIYVHDSGAGSLGNNSLDISITGGGGNNLFHNLTLKDAAKGILIALSGTSSGNAIYNNSFASTGSPIYYACGNSTNCNDFGGSIHDNDFNVGTNWAGSGMHQESLHLFSQTGATTAISGFLFYNNYMHGSWAGVGGTSHFEVSQAASGTGQGSSSGKVFNNIVVFDGGTSFPGDGAFYVQNNNNTWEFYNNTVDCVNVASVSGKGFQLDSRSGSAFIVKNNIVMNCNVPYYDEAGATDTGTATIDYNIYYNNGWGWYWKSNMYATLTTWRASPASPDAHGSTTNPGLNANYTITGTGSLAYQFGTNFTSLGVTALDSGAPQTFGSTGSCGTIGCAVRSLSVAWDLGAYATGGTSTQAPSSPTGLTAYVQ